MDYLPPASHTNQEAETTPRSASSAVARALRLLQASDFESRIQAARDIRRLTKTSQRCRRQLSGAVGPLVSMLRVDSSELNEAALLALLNLAVKDETNKISIMDAGALGPIIGFLQSRSSELQECAAAALLTLSASTVNKPAISSSGVVPLLVGILERGSHQAKNDSLMALYNLSTYAGNLSIILEAQPVPGIVALLKSYRKSSKAAEKCTALMESVVSFEEGRAALVSEEGGVFAIVDVLENGSPHSRECAVGTLLTMCQSDRRTYRIPILEEGVIPGLLELTVQGTPKSQAKARKLLILLRENPYPQLECQPDTIENIVCNIISHINGDDQSDKAKKMLTEMVQVSMEQSLRHLQQRALVCTPIDMPLNNCTSEVSSK
ncbi:hypothetical protein SAY86_007410 [Trapa natans]|uniref:U-box domain-containing protein n=1 Tax=Trapa natans TaxID=22666 RepID=A0AAN7LLT1_TRANT|nr:hypothetical protein SAY86_007410 [Trapa natans]